mgnify:CR=1 FL=1
MKVFVKRYSLKNGKYFTTEIYDMKYLPQPKDRITIDQELYMVGGREFNLDEDTVTIHLNELKYGK